MNFQDYLSRKRHEYGEKFDVSHLDDRFVRYFQTGERIKVEIYGEVKHGTVGVTTGWRPAFLLMARSNCIGSTEILDAKARILCVQKGRKYVPA